MNAPHGHHVMLKKGLGSQVPWVEDTKDILEFYDIKWFRGAGPDGNLVHAPNVAGQHTTAAAEKLYQEIFAVHQQNVNSRLTWQQGRAKIAAQLQDAGRRMSVLKFVSPP
jgi:hypothetical protein